VDECSSCGKFGQINLECDCGDRLCQGCENDHECTYELGRFVTLDLDDVPDEDSPSDELMANMF